MNSDLMMPKATVSGSMTGQRGFTLMEILVTLMVLVVGIGGLIGLQTVSVTNANNAFYRHQATILAQDMVERMMANPDATYDIDAGAVSGTKCSAAGSTCSSESNMAVSDAIEWKELIDASGLPAGDGTVTLTTVSGVDIYEVTVSWTNLQKQSAGGALLTGDDAASITLRTQI